MTRSRSLPAYLRTQALYLKAHEQDARHMSTLAMTRGVVIPAKRMMLLSGLAAFNRNITGG